MAEAEQLDVCINPRTGERIELRGGQWVKAGVATEDEIRGAMKRSLDEATLAREQMKEVSTHPDYLAMKEEQAKEGSASFGRTLLRAAPALAIGGGTAVAAARLGAGRLATMGMEATGQGVAERLAQGMMGEETDPTAMVGAGAIPLVLRGTVGAAKGLTKGLVSRSRGAQIRLAEQAGEQGLKHFVTEQLVPDDAAVSAAYKAVGDANPRVFLPGLRNTAKALKAERQSLVKSTQDKALVKQLDDFQTDLGKPTGVPFVRVQNQLQDLNARIIAAERQGGPELGALKKLRSSIWDDLDNLANTQAAGEERDLLITAIKTAKRNFALKDMAEAYNHSITHQAGIQVFSPDVFLNKLKVLKEDKLFSSTLSKELPAMEKHFKEIAVELFKTSPQGTAIIFGALGGAGGKVAGEAMGMSPGIGAAVGAAGGVSLPEVFTKLALTERGRTLTLALLKKGQGRIFMPALITAANAVAAGAKAKPGELEKTAKEVQKNPNISIEQKIQMAQQMESGT